MEQSEIYNLHADICKTLANPKRLEIINTLRDSSVTASILILKLGISKANLSQHMSILIDKGVVISRKEGVRISYELSDERIINACDLMREVLLKKLEHSGKVLKEAKKSGKSARAKKVE